MISKKIASVFFLFFLFTSVFAQGKLRTYTTEDWGYWEISGSMSNLSVPAKMAVLFIPIFTSSIYI